jgi:hypothetical protein
MTPAQILAAITAASEATKAAIALLQQHSITLDNAAAAVVAHQQQIDQQGPALPAGSLNPEGT